MQRENDIASNPVSFYRTPSCAIKYQKNSIRSLCRVSIKNGYILWFYLTHFGHKIDDMSCLKVEFVTFKALSDY